MSRRRIRLNEQLKREIAEIVRWEVADPRVGPATVTGAAVAPDLTTARVYVALIGDADERSASLEGLEAAAPYIRSQLAQRLDLRRTPKLSFFADDTMAQAARIEELLADVEPEEGWDAAPPDPDPTAAGSRPDARAADADSDVPGGDDAGADDADPESSAPEPGGPFGA
jgi:ribosome-binding factor A